MFEQLAYKPLVDSITHKAENDDQKAMLIYKYVADNTNEPQGNQNPKYNCTYDVLTHKTASCDQQVWLLMALLRVEDIDAQMVFLRGSDSISHHTVANISISGRYVMFDPFYYLYFDNRENRLATIDDLIKDPSLLPPAKTLPTGYRDLFSPKYPYKIHSDNKPDTPRRFIRSMLWGYKSILGKLFTGPFMAMHS